MDNKINRNNLEDILKQIGRVECDISNLNRKQAYIDKEINGWPDRLAYLEAEKERIQKHISNKHRYIKQLEKDLQIAKPHSPKPL